MIDDLELVYWTIGLMHEYAIKGTILRHIDCLRAWLYDLNRRKIYSYCFEI